jgi:hypothetical protein
MLWPLLGGGEHRTGNVVVGSCIAVAFLRGRATNLDSRSMPSSSLSKPGQARQFASTMPTAGIEPASDALQAPALTTIA